MPERGRRIISFVFAAMAMFSIARVLVAYRTRPSRWSTRFSLPPQEGESAASTEPDFADTTPRLVSDDEDFAAIAVLRATMASVFERGDVAAYVRAFSADAVALTAGGMSIVGSDAIADAIRRTLAVATVITSGSSVSERRAVGPNVLEEGNYHIQLRVGETDVLTSGRFAALWKREMGDWRIVFEAVRADGNEAVET